MTVVGEDRVVGLCTARGGDRPYILVVDDDPDIARFIEINLGLEGFEVLVATDGEEALARIEQRIPDLVLLDVMMPRIDGVEVTRRLRASPSTVHLPVILLTAKSLSADKVVGLTAGADDYISKPFDTVELIARVRATLRRTAELRAVSPLTGLPGNSRINAEIAARVSSGAPVAVCYCDLDGFKSFNDAYGFVRGDEVLSLLAVALRRAAAAAGDPPPFVGHIGGDDFVVVCRPEQVETVCRVTVDTVDATVPGLYDERDRERGYLEVTDRRGDVQAHPLVSVSIGVATSARRSFRDHREMVAVATEMKGVAKRQRGSAVAIDRRSHED